MVHIENVKTVRDSWQKLYGIYAEPSTENLMRLYEKIFTSHLLEDEDTGKDVQEIARNRTKIQYVSVVMDETLYKREPLRSLSTRFYSLWVDLEAKHYLSSVQDLQARILREDEWQNKFNAKRHEGKCFPKE